MDPSLFTPTQQRMLRVLSDGLPHTRDELGACLDDELAKPKAIHNHLIVLRKLLKCHGETVLCEWDRKRPRYRHVRLIKPNGQG